METPRNGEALVCSGHMTKIGTTSLTAYMVNPPKIFANDIVFVALAFLV